jgi:hypothetical protein
MTTSSTAVQYAHTIWFASHVNEISTGAGSQRPTVALRSSPYLRQDAVTQLTGRFLNLCGQRFWP